MDQVEASPSKPAVQFDEENVKQYPQESDTLDHVSLRELKLRNR